MEALDLPLPLAGILDGLACEVSRASITAAIRRQLQQGTPPLAERLGFQRQCRIRVRKGKPCPLLSSAAWYLLTWLVLPP